MIFCLVFNNKIPLLNTFVTYGVYVALEQFYFDINLMIHLYRNLENWVSNAFSHLPHLCSFIYKEILWNGKRLGHRKTSKPIKAKTLLAKRLETSPCQDYFTKIWLVFQINSVEAGKMAQQLKHLNAMVNRVYIYRNSCNCQLGFKAHLVY